MKIKTISRQLLIALLCIFSATSYAELAGKPVILVHGFDSEDLSNPTNSDSVLLRRSEDYFNDFWTSRADRHFYWSSSERVSGKIKNQMRRHFQEIEESGLCQEGCVFVTHSTGDLVLRDAISRLGQWDINPNRVKILTVLDMAGAGGGTELADLALVVSYGTFILPLPVTAAVSLYIGFIPTPNNLGVLHDLRPSNARDIAQQAQAIPRLRFVGTGEGAGDGFLRGLGDGVVPLHSACGASSQQTIYSCASELTNYGVILTNTNAPDIGPSGFLFNHFPVLMGERVDHSQVINADRVGGFYVPVVNNVDINGFDVNFNEAVNVFDFSQGLGVRYLVNSDEKPMSQHVFDTLNQTADVN
ncbi:hypothetical protein [Glaciecola petra]|uniref:Alpha/beta hydrolase n=1 Tax=Glaciecola petra TaxID=3075602 RepID=A0ABU2ZMC5_9ALTE|nr:hypothetical protein [Aestuariibacter sp. P117]MDT0593773.1 hypothetical protein [Aestuariibacter sp. P117]